MAKKASGANAYIDERFDASGGVQGKGKKSGGPSGGNGFGGGKLKKNTQFKSLKKKDNRTAVIEKKGKPGSKKHVVAKKPIQVSDELRNFNERMAGVKKRSNVLKFQAAAAENIKIAAPTFVMAAPTFAFGAPAVKEVEGFHGFLTSMTAPKDVQQPRVDHEARKVKPVQPVYQGSNVFSVLQVDDEEDQQRSHVQQQQRQPFAAAAVPSPPPAPHFLQPATFSFQSATAPAFRFQAPAASASGPSSTFSSGLQAAAGRSSASHPDVDPDL